MSEEVPVFRSSEAYIQRQLDMVEEKDRPKLRLELDIADILTGPTSGGNARYIAEKVATNPRSAAIAMKQAAERYLASVKDEEG